MITIPYRYYMLSNKSINVLLILLLDNIYYFIVYVSICYLILYILAGCLPAIIYYILFCIH